MNDARAANLVGALTLALADELSAVTEAGAGHKSACPAAIISVGSNPGISIETLRRILGLSHSGTVRLLDQLEAEGVVERKPGKDARSVALVLTPPGRRTYREILDARREAMSAALSPLSAAERVQFIKLTEKLLFGMTRNLDHSDQICRLCEETVCPSATCPVNCAVVGRS